MKRTSLMVLVLLFAVKLFAQERAFIATRRVAKDHIALIIGNSNYPDMPLANPVNDANSVSNTFRDMGFIVEELLDADRESIAIAIEKFSQKLATARAAVFYFSGHGMQIDGENYLIPIGRTEATQISTEDQVPYRAINANEILRAMESRQVNFAMVVLDACRNNPISGTGKGRLKGLASVDAPAGSLVMYATKAGDIAYDGTNAKNSPFTTAFLQHITTPGLDVNLLPSKITKTVMEQTDGKQIPGTYMQLTQSFTFVPELTPDELDEIHRKQAGELSELQHKKAEMDRQRQQEEEEMIQKQAEIDKLEKQIEEMKSKTVSGSDADDLDKMLVVIEKRKQQQAELDTMKKRAEAQRLKREKELAALKRKKFEEKIEKYNKIANSKFGQDMKTAAWNVILKHYGFRENSIKEGDVTTLGKEIGLELLNDLPGYITDIDRNTYKVIEIGSQVWMAENLRTTKYRDGTSVPNVTDNDEWSNLTTPAYSWYNNDSTNKIQYGALYNWYAVETDKLCPTGWHVPSNWEWTELKNYLIKNGYNHDGTTEDDRIAKSLASTSGWNSSDKKGDIGNDMSRNNRTAFNAFPGGYRYAVGGSFDTKGAYTYWWSSTAHGSRNSYYHGLWYLNSTIEQGNSNRRYGFSVRCVQD